MQDKTVAIIDIGTTKIVSLVGQKDPSGNLHILGYGEAVSQGVERGLVSNMNEASEVINKAVEQAKLQSKIDFKEVFVGIAGQHIYSTQNSHSVSIDDSGEITQAIVDKLTSEVYNMAINPGETIIHVFPQEYSVDGQPVRNPVGAMGRQLSGRFHISIGKEKSIKLIRKAIEKIGLNIIKIILEPVASAEAVLIDEEKEAGVVLLDIGGGTSDMIIIKDNIIKHTAVIPFGGNVITRDIQTGCQILANQAEELKIKYGSAIADVVDANSCATVPGIGGREPREISFKTIAEIIQHRVIEIIDTIEFEIKNSMSFSDLAAGITITGGGALLKHLGKLMEYRIGLETKIAYPRKYSFYDNQIFNHPKYATSIGLLIKGYDYLEKIKLLNQNSENVIKNKKIEDDNINVNKIIEEEKNEEVEQTDENNDLKPEDDSKKKKKSKEYILDFLKKIFIDEDKSNEV